MKTNQIQIGSKVKKSMGLDRYRVILVEDIEIQGKNGLDVIDGTLISQDSGIDGSKPGDKVWGYVRDIVGTEI